MRATTARIPTHVVATEGLPNQRHRRGETVQEVLAPHRSQLSRAEEAGDGRIVELRGEQSGVVIRS
jgi:hypothetical protein